MILAWLRAFSVTVVIEVPLVVLLTRDLSSRWPRRAALALFGQLTTHPLVWFVLPRVPGLTLWQITLVSELFAWLAESVLYATVLEDLRPLRAVGIAGVANAASFAVGLVLPIV
jgi:hypothetical protein